MISMINLQYRVLSVSVTSLEEVSILQMKYSKSPFSRLSLLANVLLSSDESISE